MNKYKNYTIKTLISNHSTFLDFFKDQYFLTISTHIDEKEFLTVK